MCCVLLVLDSDLAFSSRVCSVLLYVLLGSVLLFSIRLFLCYVVSCSLVLKLSHLDLFDSMYHIFSCLIVCVTSCLV